MTKVTHVKSSFLNGFPDPKLSLHFNLMRMRITKNKDKSFEHPGDDNQPVMARVYS